MEALPECGSSIEFYRICNGQCVLSRDEKGNVVFRYDDKFEGTSDMYSAEIPQEVYKEAIKKLDEDGECRITTETNGRKGILELKITEDGTHILFHEQGRGTSTHCRHLTKDRLVTLADQ